MLDMGNTSTKHNIKTKVDVVPTQNTMSKKPNHETVGDSQWGEDQANTKPNGQVNAIETSDGQAKPTIIEVKGPDLKDADAGIAESQETADDPSQHHVHTNTSDPRHSDDHPLNTKYVGLNGHVNNHTPHNDKSEMKSNAMIVFSQAQTRPECQHLDHGRHLHDETVFLRRKLRMAEEKAEQLERENDELRIRMSKQVSDRLTDNNPQIADLSDKNRPTKIAERYIEMYNNEWSNAYESLEKTDSQLREREIVDILLYLLKAVYDQCRTMAHEQTRELKASMVKYSGRDKMNKNMTLGMKVYKDERKRNYKITRQMIQRDGVIEIYLSRTSKTKHIEAYVDLAIELCWLMCVQDPPVVLQFECKQGQPFDKGVFLEYMLVGDRYDFLIWPPLRLHENGPLLKKGVAQPIPTQSEGKQTTTEDRPSRNKAFT